MQTEIITDREDLVIHRMTLEPGECTHWHTDACHRFTVVVSGSRLRIEYRDSGETTKASVHPGATGWDAPDDRVHRAVNVGHDTYQEVVTFYRVHSDTEPQPEAPARVGPE